MGKFPRPRFLNSLGLVGQFEHKYTVFDHIVIQHFHYAKFKILILLVFSI